MRAYCGERHLGSHPSGLGVKKIKMDTVVQTETTCI